MTVEERTRGGLWILVGSAAALYAIAFIAWGGFEPILRRDEVHFWPTSLLFSHSFVPSLATLRDYDELNTPLAFILFGWLELAFGAGVAAGRVLNAILGLAILGMVALRPGRLTATSIACALGLLLYPYFVGVSFHLYTDILAVFFALLGVIAFASGKHALAALAFVLGISTRQYIVAFPVACLIYAALDEREHRTVAVAAYALAIGSLFGWVALFGGLAPRSAVLRYDSYSMSLLHLRPQHALYFLTCVGLYFVVIELVLLRRFRSEWAALRTHTVSFLCVAAAVGISFFMLPPLGNATDYTESMGYLDVAARALLTDSWRMILFCSLAVFACWRFRRWELATVLVYVNAAMLSRAHIGWDKYALPMIVVLWYMQARPEGTPGGDVAGDRLTTAHIQLT